jgi:hypothetical protein
MNCTEPVARQAHAADQTALPRIKPRRWRWRSHSQRSEGFVYLRVKEAYSGVTIEEIAHLVGHGSTSVTERVYRKELRPVITRGARAINELFDGDTNR